MLSGGPNREKSFAQIKIFASNNLGGGGGVLTILVLGFLICTLKTGPGTMYKSLNQGLLKIYMYKRTSVPMAARPEEPEHRVA